MEEKQTGNPRRVHGRWLGLAAVLLVAAGLTAVVVSLPSHSPQAGTQPTPESSGCACASEPPTAPPGALSREAAVRAALRAVPSTANSPTIVWAAVEPYPFEDQAGSTGRFVWEVRLEGGFGSASCAPDVYDRWPTPSDPVCLDADSGVIVVLDINSGQFLGWSH